MTSEIGMLVPSAARAKALRDVVVAVEAASDARLLQSLGLARVEVELQDRCRVVSEL